MKNILDKNPFLSKILDAEAKSLVEGLDYDKTIVYRKSKKWTLYFNSKQFINPTSLEKIEKQIKEKIDDLNSLNIIIQYQWDKQFFKKNYNSIWEDIISKMQKDRPSCTNWLINSKHSFDGDKISIYIKDQFGFKFLKDKGVDEYISEYIHKYFNNRLKVRLNYKDEDIRETKEDYLAQRDNETNQIVKIQTKHLKRSINLGRDGPKNLNTLIYGKPFKGNPIDIDDISEETGRAVIEGVIFDIDIRETRNGKFLFIIYITDYTNSIAVKFFSDKDEYQNLKTALDREKWIRVKGHCVFDNYQKETVIRAESILTIQRDKRMDKSEEKRVELHAHTNMSAMDATTPVAGLIKRAALWGHKAIAITDHGVVQAFPDAYRAGKENDIKVIFGVEGYLIDDCKPIVKEPNTKDLNQAFVVFDIETTGLNAQKDKITEIGAVKIENREIVDRFQTFINPGVPIPKKIANLTGITDEMVSEAPDIGNVLTEFKKFTQDCVLVAHNAQFDMGFILHNAGKHKLSFFNPVLDTLALSRAIFKDLNSHRLDVIANYLNIELKNHHRALDDAITTCSILLKAMDIMDGMGIKTLDDINSHIQADVNLNSLYSYHVILLARTQEGLKNLYTIISKSHLDYFYRNPRIPKSLLSQYRDGIIIGSACEAGELYRAIIDGSDDNTIEGIARFYDYLEIQPLENNEFYIRQNRLTSFDELKDINKKIVKLGENLDIPVVATGDVHFLDPEDECFRRILMGGQGYKDADNQAPLYFKTTEEMLDEFAYLGEEKSREVVIYNPNKIADNINEIEPFPAKLYAPTIEGSDREIEKMATDRAKSIYGDPLPEEVSTRLKKELDSIIGNGYAVLYLISHKLVRRSLDDGYLVGSRGSVGSSFVATLTDITEVNPLPPHYVCPSCQTSDFDVDTIKYGCGIDLPDKKCPNCGTMYNKDGFDIPFEVFLGFEGDKIPDIDLNFSGEYQHIAHKYTEELFGEGHVFRAGTIGKIANKTAFGFIKKYLDERGVYANSAEIKRLIRGCSGVKRTTGQHPGGVMVLPRGKDIHEITPIQYPADAKDSGIITTHFDYDAISDTLVKLDILGHDDPTVIKMLEELTGIDATKIPLDDPKTMQLFSGTESLKVCEKEIGSPIGTYGIPEFGTKFVRQMLMDTRPTTFSELIRISGLSHGTDVWLNNAQKLVKDGIAELSEVICTRDDIMIYLIHKGLEPTDAFSIMEKVRRGRGVTLEEEAKMDKYNVPKWFIESCKKIKYMFPKAHAAAYVLMAFRIAYFKVHYPEQFYAVYLTIKSADCDMATILEGKDSIRKQLKELESKGNSATSKERGMMTVFEVALEMLCRGIDIIPIDLYKSDATNFKLTKEGILPPLCSLQGISINAAKSIKLAQKDGPFVSIEELRTRSKIPKTAIDVLADNGILEGLPETSQISLF
ncbi:MAG: PolC-type DNA polymerase III [Clostridiales bacterium]|nr:PolC-type DNA polymerase III [Clostridiales bacterium]